MAIVFPATVMVPVRGKSEPLAVTEKVTFRLPDPLAPLMLIQERLSVAVQLQPVEVVTENVELPASELRLRLVGDTV